MSEAVYDTTEGEFVDFDTLEEWATIDKSKDARIEELEVKLRSSALQELSALSQASEAYQAQLAVEAKLAKAVDALKYYAHDDDDGGWLAKSTLAEITGGKDE